MESIINDNRYQSIPINRLILIIDDNRWGIFVWLSIGIDYQYQLIDKLVSIAIDWLYRITEPESMHKKHNFVRSNYKHISC